MPLPLLERVGDPMELELDDFIRLLSRARCLEEIEEQIVAQGIARAFSDGET